MPKGLWYHSLVPFGNSIVMLGGIINKEIYELTCSDKIWKWTKMDQELSFGRYQFVAIPIPTSLANCEN